MHNTVVQHNRVSCPYQVVEVRPMALASEAWGATHLDASDPRAEREETAKAKPSWASNRMAWEQLQRSRRCRSAVLRIAEGPGVKTVVLCAALIGLIENTRG